MRKPLAITAAALVLLGSTQLPAQAAAGPEAPTDLQLSWVAPGNQQVKMTWADGGEANIVRVEYQDGHQVTRFTSKPGTPNEWTRVGHALVWTDRVARISVVSIDESGAESAPVVSPWFDSIGAPLPTFTSAVPLPDGSLKLNWSLAPVPVDTTPGDPLDLPSTNEVVKLAVATTPNAPGKSFTLPAGSTTFTIPTHPRPYPVAMLTTNEWVIRGGTTGSSSVVFNETTVGLSVPATNVYSQSLPFSIVAGTRMCANAQYNCPDRTNPFVANPGIRTLLQARPDAARPWKTIGTYTNQQLRFTANVRLYGGQQYRLYIPTWSHLNGRELTVAPAASTSARYSATQAKFAVAGFNTSTATVGQIVKTTVDVLPAGTVKADLQWYDGKVWRHATYISLTKGKGTFSFKAAGRGTSRYWRVVVPKMTMNGLPIVATPSKAFKLTVR
ncbi:hypothetical protein [Kribbella sp. CA-294648]|uniref:hypothetical protein n=1 Tax=Kribbella sp. CA-294648 TaxID=3239948 RepID=UPI003D931029